MNRLHASCLLVALLVAKGAAPAAEQITVYRDSFGVPHIYAETLAGAAYAAGYSQAEDRLEQMLKNYRLAAGTMAEIGGAAALEYDVRSRVWQHERVARDGFSKLAPNLQAACTAYIAGVNQFMADHPDQKPAWAQKLEPYFPIMLSRFIIWGWPEGQAADDLENGGIKPQPLAYRGSNEWCVAPQRSAVGAPIALIDPHLSWYGPFRFYEQRMYASREDFAVSGACILGVPMPGLGHSQYLSVAMTTGGPDTADVYEETIREHQGQQQYQIDGQWRDIETRTETIRVREQDKVAERTIKIGVTHHGPILAVKGDKAYSMATPYFNEIGLMDELYRVMTAQNLDQAKAALANRQLMPQNVMIATVEGDIYYVRTGRVPVRDHGLPTDRPVPGHVAKHDHRGVHQFEELVQVVNPPQGYMQNCNISPEHLMKNSSLTRDKYRQRPYLYNAEEGPAHQRARMTLEQLAGDDSVTIDEALEIAFSTEVWAADEWQKRIAAAWDALPAEARAGDAQHIYEQIKAWDRRSLPESQAALAYYFFKKSLGDEPAKSVHVPDALTNEQIGAALVASAQTLKQKFGRLDVPYGDFFRVGREGGDKSYPVGGGTLKDAGMATPRAISFHDGDKQRLGHGGQTSTQVVVLTRPPKSYMVLPLGESDHPQSGHWDDQAEKLFGPGKAKDTYFMNRAGVSREATSTKELVFKG